MSKKPTKTVVSEPVIESIREDNFSFEFTSIPVDCLLAGINSTVMEVHLPSIMRGKSNAPAFSELIVRLAATDEFHIQTFYNWITKKPGHVGSATLTIKSPKGDSLYEVNLFGLEIIDVSGLRFSYVPSNFSFAETKIGAALEYLITLRVGKTTWGKTT